MRRSRRIFAFGSMLVVLGLVTALGGAASGESANDRNRGKGPDPALVKKLKDSARGSVTLSAKSATGYVGFARAGQNGDLLPADGGASGKGKAKRFLDEYGALLGGGSDGSQLVEVATLVEQDGATHVTYEQRYRGVPVFGATVRAHLDAANNLTAVNGVVVPDIDIDVAPRLSAEQAAARAVAAVVASPPGEDGAKADVSGVRAASSELHVYRTGLIRGVDGAAQLVYRVEVTNGANVRELVFVHAHAGKLVNRYSLVHDGLSRRLYERVFPGGLIWSEGDPFPGALNGDQQNLVNFSGDSYRFFFNAFDRDSFDGLGSIMHTVNNDPRINCPNANWNGITTNYCNGVTSDDVVAHEWGHAYTQYTSDLIYQWQPGALNESYSDIWGETVDLLNGAGTDTPGGTRSVGACTTHTPPVPEVVIHSPAAIAGICAAGAAQFGPPVTAAGVTGNVVLGLDPADAAGPSTTDACSPLTNAAAVAGNIALVDRGTCGFAIKVKNAQNAGAIAVIVADNVAGPVAGMGGVDPTITITSVRITLANGNLIKSALPGPVSVTIKAKGTGTPEDSYRWLMGEDSTAFGGAIRDLWNPNCMADPGKVTDVEYHCATSDGGGVHTNSGVPNHGFALLVDGGTFNGRTITAIGLVKASHLYWRAQAVYQTPTTDFDDHADALEQACTDLTGVPLEGLSTSSTPAGPSGQAITAGDCAEVGDMIAAIELRTDPTEQCNFQPLLGKNPPALCTDQKNAPTIWAEDFEDGLAGWTLTNQGVFAGWPGTNWVADGSLPAGRAGTAAFGENLQIGNCDGGAGDVSGVMRLQSPPIHLPNAAILSPRLTFEHYVATEAGWDGGNLKISINGGAFVAVPAAAFLYNGYNANLQTAAAGNTNPLAGQPAYTGTDGGEVGGSWGETQIDLTKLGIEPGDTIQLRFDFGMDGCTGIDGWYVDDVEVRACNTKKSNVTAKED